MADKNNKQAEVKSIDQLRADLDGLQNDLMEAKTGLSAGELANPMVIRKLRRDIARVKTEIRARELEPTKEEK